MSNTGNLTKQLEEIFNAHGVSVTRGIHGEEAFVGYKIDLGREVSGRKELVEKISKGMYDKIMNSDLGKTLKYEIEKLEEIEHLQKLELQELRKYKTFVDVTKEIAASGSCANH